MIRSFEDLKLIEAANPPSKQPRLPWSHEVMKKTEHRSAQESPLKEEWLAEQRAKGIFYDQCSKRGKPHTIDSKKE